MNITEEQYTRICKFLDAEMSMEEMVLFEKELEQNTAIQQQLQFEQSIREAYFEGNNQVSFPEKVAVKTTRIKWLYAVAAASIIAVAIPALFFNTHSNKSNSLANNTYKTDTVQATTNALESIAKNIFNKHYTKPTLTQNSPIILAEAVNDYENNQYNKLLAFNESNIPETRSSADTVNNKDRIIVLLNYYKGVAYIQQTNYEMAIKHLAKTATQNKYIVEKNNAEWYLAMAYFNVNIDAAKTILQQIASNPRHIYNTNAKKVLQELK